MLALKKLINSPWVIVGSLAAVVLVIYFSGKAAGKRAIGDPSSVKLVTGTGPQLPPGWSPVPLAQKLHRAMSGWLSGGDGLYEAWMEMAQLPTDVMFVNVYKAFNDMYYKENYGTLTKWVQDELFLHFGGTNPKTTLLARLAHLNCL